MLIIYDQLIRNGGIVMGAVVIQVERKGEITVVAMTGELDSLSATDAQDQVLPLVERGCKILLDMSGVTYMSSAGLRILLLLYRQIQENVGRVVITGLGDEIREVMEITGFLDFFKTTEKRNDGLRLLSE